MYLSPPNSCYQWTSRNLLFTNFPNPAILPDCICQTSPSSFSKFPKLTKLQNTLHTLNRCEFVFGYKHKWTSQSLVFTNFPNPAILPNCIYQTSPTSFRKFPKLTKLQNTLHTLNRCGFVFGYKSPLNVEQWERKEKKLQ